MAEQLYNILLWTQLLVAPVILVSLLFVTAPYGRHQRKGWGIIIDTRLGWILMELPAVLTIFLVFCFSVTKASSMLLVFLIIWEVHYIYRTFYFPFQLRASKKSFPYLIILFAVIFNIINGYINGYYLFNKQAFHESSILGHFHFWLGSFIFLAGFIMHVHSDHIIINLRKDPNVDYAIPRGGMFRYVTNPNYLGEFIQWTGWAILTWSLPGLSFALFTFCNLFPRAISNHKWYKEKFPEYPKSRKRFFPFIY